MSQPHTTPQPQSRDPQELPALPTLKRTFPRPYTQHPIYWHRPHTMRFIRSVGDGWRSVGEALEGTALSDILEWIEIDASFAEGDNYATVYLVGGWDAPSTPDDDYYQSPVELSHWTIEPGSWRDNPRSVTYKSLSSPMKIRVGVTAAWFDDADVSLTIFSKAWHKLNERIDARWSVRGSDGKKHTAGIRNTPAFTGLELLECSLPFQQPLPMLPDELRRIIQHNSPQGRNEVFTAPGGQNAQLEQLAELVCYDAKWMYMACTSHVPAGPVEDHSYGDHHLAWDNFDDWTVGFYRFTAIIPNDWHHIGLLPQRVKIADEWRTVYPWQPGTCFEGWATGAELKVAKDNGWLCWIVQAITWPLAQKWNPLATWREKLVMTRGYAEWMQEDEGTRDTGKLMATAVRHIAIDAIGAMARRVTRERHVTPYAESSAIPTDAYDVDPQDDGIHWYRDVPLSGFMAKYQHPEIAAMIWGRVRARGAEFALQLPIENIILWRTDALWLAINPHEDYRHETPAHLFLCQALEKQDKSGRPGDWREKEYLPGPVAAPRNTADALTLIRAARHYEALEDEGDA